jgi:hypothetical protein
MRYFDGVRSGSLFVVGRAGAVFTKFRPAAAKGIHLRAKDGRSSEAATCRKPQTPSAAFSQGSLRI